MKKKSLLNKWGWQNWTSAHWWMKTDPDLFSFMNVNIKWIKDLNVSPGLLWLLRRGEENTSTRGYAGIFVNGTWVAQEIANSRQHFIQGSNSAKRETLAEDAELQYIQNSKYKPANKQAKPPLINRLVKGTDCSQMIKISPMETLLGFYPTPVQTAVILKNK